MALVDVALKKQLKVPKTFLKKRPKLEDSYVLGASLGQGGFGEVFAANRRLDKVDVAIKFLPKHGAISPEREVAMMEQLDHPNIVKIFDSFNDNRKFYIVMELCDGDLPSLLGDCEVLKEAEMKKLCGQIILALGHMHSKAIVYRDLKPSNILLKHGVVKLCDFGAATVLVRGQVDGQFCQWIGSMGFCSPELLAAKHSRSVSYGVEVDWWSLGVMSFLLVSGDLPFAYDHVDNGDRQATLAAEKDFQLKVCEGASALDFPSELSPEGVDFIRRLMHKDPVERLSLETSQAHPFFANEQRAPVNSKPLERQCSSLAAGKESPSLERVDIFDEKEARGYDTPRLSSTTTAPSSPEAQPPEISAVPMEIPAVVSEEATDGERTTQREAKEQFLFFEPLSVLAGEGDAAPPASPVESSFFDLLRGLCLCCGARPKASR